MIDTFNQRWDMKKREYIVVYRIFYMYNFTF